jgi:hypothetical protein
VKRVFIAFALLAAAALAVTWALDPAGVGCCH